MSKTQTIARALAPAIAIAAALTCGGAATAASLIEDFRTNASGGQGFETRGWKQQNNSTAPGSEPDWVQGGGGTPYTAFEGAANSYVTVNYQSVEDVGDGPETISNWLISPTMTFNNNDQVSFFTRTDSRSLGQGFYPDRLQLRFSKVGGTDVGTQPDDVGTFTTLLLEVNPTLAIQGQPGAYPTDWTPPGWEEGDPLPFLATITGISNGTQGAIAFRYFVEDGGPGSKTRSNIIAIDKVTVGPNQGPITAVPEPAAYLMMGLGLGVIGLRRMRATRG